MRSDFEPKALKASNLKLTKHPLWHKIELSKIAPKKYLRRKKRSSKKRSWWQRLLERFKR